MAEELRMIMQAIKEVDTNVKNMHADFDKRLGRVESELGQVKLEVGSLKAELGQVKRELGQVKTELGQAKTELGQVKSDVKQIKIGLKQTNQKIDDLRDDMNDQIRLLRDDHWNTRKEVEKIKRLADAKL